MKSSHKLLFYNLNNREVSTLFHRPLILVSRTSPVPFREVVLRRYKFVQNIFPRRKENQNIFQKFYSKRFKGKRSAHNIFRDPKAPVQDRYTSHNISFAKATEEKGSKPYSGYQNLGFPSSLNFVAYLLNLVVPPTPPTHYGFLFSSK